jgi:hypothetical protein
MYEPGWVKKTLVKAPMRMGRYEEPEFNKRVREMN